MRINLAVADARGKNIAFASDSLEAFSIQEALKKAESKAIENISMVNGVNGGYLRSVRNGSKSDNLDSLTVSVMDIFEQTNRTEHAKSTDPLSGYMKTYFASLAEVGGPYIEPVGDHKAMMSSVKDKIVAHASIIKEAAKEFEIDSSLLGAILIDEIARLSPFEDIVDLLLLETLGRNVSVGIAQVKLETANDIIRTGLYNPNSQDKKLPFSGRLSKEDRRHLYTYVIKPEYNIRFAAAYIRGAIEFWSKKLDVSNRPEILATMYSSGYGSLKIDPQPKKRGKQIAEEFSVLAGKWLNQKQ